MELVGLSLKAISYLRGGALIVGVLLFYILQGVGIHRCSCIRLLFQLYIGLPFRVRLGYKSVLFQFNIFCWIY